MRHLATRYNFASEVTSEYDNYARNYKSNSYVHNNMGELT